MPPTEDPRVYLAAERTFLAWIRTGLALMGFGFVVARFVNLFSALQHIRFVRSVRRGVEVVDRPITMAVAIALILAATGVAMTIYLVFVR